MIDQAQAEELLRKGIFLFTAHHPYMRGPYLALTEDSELPNVRELEQLHVIMTANKYYYGSHSSENFAASGFRTVVLKKFGDGHWGLRKAFPNEDDYLEGPLGELACGVSPIPQPAFM